MCAHIKNLKYIHVQIVQYILYKFVVAPKCYL